MTFRTILLAGAAAILAACSGGDSEHGVSTDPNAATGFITGNQHVPETADLTRADGVPRDADGRPFTYALLGKPLPDFTGKTASGGTFSSANINQWTVIDVWGIWCGDCIADGPFVAEVAARIALDDDLDFVSIHTPPSAARVDEAYGKFGSVSAYFDAKGYSYPTVLDTDASLRERLEIIWTPSYLLVSPDGVVRGYRTDLSVAGDTPIDDFFNNIAEVRAVHADILPRQKNASIGTDGTEGISGITRFDRKSIERAFPMRTIVAGQVLSEGDAYPVFNVLSSGPTSDLMYTVWPNWDLGHVGIVQTKSPDVEGPGGAQIGKLRFGELAKSETENCFDGEDDYAGQLICSVGDNLQFQYVFSAGRGDEGISLAIADPDTKARAVLSEFRYLPPTPEMD